MFTFMSPDLERQIFRVGSAVNISDKLTIQLQRVWFCACCSVFIFSHVLFLIQKVKICMLSPIQLKRRMLSGSRQCSVLMWPQVWIKVAWALEETGSVPTCPQPVCVMARAKSMCAWIWGRNPKRLFWGFQRAILETLKHFKDPRFLSEEGINPLRAELMETDFTVSPTSSDTVLGV